MSFVEKIEDNLCNLIFLGFSSIVWSEPDKDVGRMAVLPAGDYSDYMMVQTPNIAGGSYVKALQNQ